MMNDRVWYFPEAESDMTLVITMSSEKEDLPDAVHSFLIIREAQRFFSVNLFLKRCFNEYFNLVYEGGGGEVKIWEVRDSKDLWQGR